MQRNSINNPQLLDITMPDGGACTGGNQEWYSERWHRMSGCGPVAASNLVWYQARSRKELSGLCDVGSSGQSDFLTLMDAMFSHITPKSGGIHSSRLFIPGLLKYCNERGFRMAADTLEIPERPRRSPMREQLRGFLARWLSGDCAVAFLNLSNGTLAMPDSWHWVTITAFSDDSFTALISDEGRCYEADLSKWLDTSMLGGAFVTLYDPQELKAVSAADLNN